MTHRHHSSTDPARSLALLWGSQTEAGRSGLTLKDIVAAAIAIADADGVDALTMRKVAERLGTGTMTLYTHVPSKTDLMDLMVDTVYGHLYASMESPSQQPGDWRDALRFIAQHNLDLYRQHPWLLQVATVRAVLGPHAITKYEAELRPLDRLGLSDVEMDAVLALVLAHVEGVARAQTSRAQTHQDTAMTDEEWWVARAPLLDKLIDPARFPVATRVGTAAGQEYHSAASPEFAFSFGLERILEGVATLIAANNTSAIPTGDNPPKEGSASSDSNS